MATGLTIIICTTVIVMCFLFGCHILNIICNELFLIRKALEKRNEQTFQK
jgi:hypothetical protein